MDKKQEERQQINTVMVVDDDPTWCFLSKRVLQRAGVGKQILMAQDGLEAVKALKALAAEGSRLPELIFLDIKMPLMDGFEVLEEITKWPELDLNQTRIFICSTSSHSSDQERASQYPVAGYITKPLTQEILSNILS